MAYFQGFSPTSEQGNTTPDVAKASGIGVMGGSNPVPTANTPQAGQMSAPNAVLQNIQNYAGSGGTLMGNANMNSGLRNYNAMSQAYNPGGMGQWSPWALNAQSAGGGGFDSISAGNLFNGRANPLAAGSNYSFGDNAKQIMQSQYYRNPYTGDVQNTGAAQQVKNPYGEMYDMNNITRRYIQQQLGKGVGMGDNPYAPYNQGVEDYYKSVMGGFGNSPFDTQNFNKGMISNGYNAPMNKPMLSPNAPHNAQNQQLVNNGTYGGWGGPAPQPNYMGGYGYMG